MNVCTIYLVHNLIGGVIKRNFYCINDTCYYFFVFVCACVCVSFVCHVARTYFMTVIWAVE
jgi:hypothetical protein